MTTTADTSVRIMDPETAPDGVLGAFNPAELDLSANSRKDAESKVTPDDIAGARAMATLHDYGCGNAQPVEIRRRPDGTLRVRDGARRTLMCGGAGVPVFGFIAGPRATRPPTRGAGWSPSGSAITTTRIPPRPTTPSSCSPCSIPA